MKIFRVAVTAIAMVMVQTIVCGIAMFPAVLL